MLSKVMFTLGLLSCAVLVQAQDKEKAVLLSNNGLPAKDIESVLPTGSVAHLRINNLEKTLTDSEAFALTLLPKEIIPTDLVKVFEKPNPLLTLVGMKTLGEAIGPSSIATATGIDITRPVTATVYPRKKDPLVIAVPIANHDKFARVLTALVGARRFTPITNGTIVIPSKADFPKRLYVTCSSNYAFICMSEHMLNMIHDKTIPRMNTGNVIPKAVSQYKNDDIVLIGDPIAGKTFINQFKAFNKIPEAPMIRVRELISKGMTPQIRSQLKWRFPPDPISSSSL